MIADMAATDRIGKRITELLLTTSGEKVRAIGRSESNSRTSETPARKPS